MRKLLCFIFMSILWLSSLPVYAQLKTITGTVTGEGDRPLSGVNVSVRGSDRAAQSNASGTFSISASVGEYLLFTYVGYAPSELKVGNESSISVRMGINQSQMEEVIVTAMDIRRNPKELAFSVQKVSGSDIQETQRENFINSLQGRVAGLTVTPTSGMAGASSQIVLRGFNSMALSNSPLFVIDGIIVDNSALSENDASIGFGARPATAPGAENRSNDYQNRIADLNPNDIESVTVLKGPEATALYGSQASSGAIVVTTKKSATKGRVGVAYDNSFRWSKITRIPEIQRTFSEGTTNGNPAIGYNYFGPAYDSTQVIYENDIRDFFQTGFAQNHNIGLDFGGKDYTLRFSGSAFFQQSPVPENTFNKYNARLSGTAKIGKYIDIAPSINFIRSVNEKPLRGAGGYLINFLAWPADNDITNYKSSTGMKLPIYYANPQSDIDNPYWNVEKNRSEDQNDRMVATMGININPFTWLSVNGRFGFDTYAQDGFIRYDSLSNSIGLSLKGAQTNYYRRYYGYNHTVTATGKHTIGDFTGRIMIGNMWQDYETQMTTVYGTNLASFSAKDSNYSDPTTRFRNINMVRNGLPNYSISRQAAYFGEFSLNWKSAVFLTYSHRFEESSIFPEAVRNYNYPAGGLSIMVSDLFPSMKEGKILNYLKLRGSLASTARSGAPYNNQSVFNQNLGNGGGWYYGFTNANPLLEPETQQTYEIGTEMRLFNSRLNFDITYYNTKNSNLIVELFRTSYGTGFVLNTLNVGANQNTGLEIALDAVPVRSTNFTWTTRLNFNKMKNEVTELPPNVPEFYISDTWLVPNSNARGGLIVGGPTTSITGFAYARNKAGEILISPVNGLPKFNNTFVYLGDRNPDFTLGWVNNLTYKDWKLSMLWDLKMGGDIFNGTEFYLTRIGRSLQTGDRFTPRVIEGVLQDGLENTDNPTKNTISVIPYYNTTYYTANATFEGLPEEAFVQKDVNWLRLRDITLSYTFPTSGLRNNLKFVRSLSAFVTGNDLILITNYLGADPAVNGTSAGSRGVGAFGFDYGNVGTPISINIGLRANF